MQGDVSSREAASEDAKALFENGRFAEASALYLRLSEEFPKNRHYKTAYARAAIEACRDLPDTSKHREELRDYVLQKIVIGGDEKDRARALRFLAALGAWQEGANLLLQIEKQESSLGDIDVCFRFIPRFIERGSRAALWRPMHMRLRRMWTDLDEEQKVEALELELKLLLAMERFPEYVALFEKRRSRFAASSTLNLFENVSARLTKSRSQVFAEPKVFGIGLSRTGTTSLASALSILGIDAAHWTNPLTHQILSDADFFMFGACTDCSVSAEFEKLYYLYPNAQFVYTARDVDAWAQSFWEHHRRVSWAGDMASFREAFSQRPFPDAAVEFALYTTDDVRESYRAFEQRVRGFFSGKPKGKLLELDISAGQGWPELCAFLGRPVPETPFPKLNTSKAG
jgi:hypothetical protein